VDEHQELAGGADAIIGNAASIAMPSMVVITGLDPVIYALFSGAERRGWLERVRPWTT
jgi:hypothetical protein